MKIRNSKCKLSEEEISNFERTIGFKFPIDYYTFLIKNNGGVPDRTDFDYKGFNGEDSSVVQYLTT